MSEQTIQDNLYSIPVEIMDKYTCLSLGATTVNDLISSGKLNKNIKVSKNLGKKPDVLIVDKNKEVVVFIEFKKPTEFNTLSKIQKAIDQEIDVAKEVKAKIYIVSDGETFIWINPLTKNRILNIDGSEVRQQVKPKKETKKLATFIENVVLSISKTNDQILRIEDIDPTNLAVKIAGILKRMTFASSKMSLYTFVEVFLFKYLSDINILSCKNSFDYIYGLYEDENFTDADVLGEYLNGPRDTIKNLFPEGEDGTTIINGQVFHVLDTKDNEGHYISEDNTDAIFHSILNEFKEYEKIYGKFINISKDFKSKLFETFMKNSDDKSEMGQFFTPLKVVEEMVEMVKVEKGMKICDPACGVGKFLLEVIAKNPDLLEEYKFNGTKLKKGVELYGFEKTMSGKDDITTILAKANSLIYFSDLFRQNNDSESIKYLSEELLNKTFVSSKTQLGTLDKLEENKYDLILANPPYYQDANISKLAKNTNFYTKNGKGIEGLFFEWIIKSLKPNGIANIVLPDGIFSNIGNKDLKEYILTTCDIEAIISLPINTFFNTPKKTYIIYIKKKPLEKNGTKQTHKVFTYICNSIGESLDSYRFPIEDNHLHEAVNKFNSYKSLKDKNKIEEPFKSWFDNDKKLKFKEISEFNSDDSWIIDNFWSDEEKIELGFKKDTTKMTALELSSFVDEIIDDIQTYKEVLSCLM